MPQLLRLRSMLLRLAAALELPPNPLDDLTDRMGGEAAVAELTGRKVGLAGRGSPADIAQRGLNDVLCLASLGIAVLRSSARLVGRHAWQTCPSHVPGFAHPCSPVQGMLVRAGDSKVEYKQRVEGVAQHMANMAEKQVRAPVARRGGARACPAAR